MPSLLSRSFFHAGAAGVLALGCTACGTLTQRAEAVRLTASPQEVAGCELIGPVNVGTYDAEFDQRQRDLRYETARAGGNVLKVHSFALATGGQAYRCDRPLNADRVAS
jgi:hypothetical protein